MSRCPGILGHSDFLYAVSHGCYRCCNAKSGAQLKSSSISFLRISKQLPLSMVMIASSLILVCTKLFPLKHILLFGHIKHTTSYNSCRARMGRRPRPSSRYINYSVATVSIFATVKPTFLAHALGQGPCGLGPISATVLQVFMCSIFTKNDLYSTVKSANPCEYTFLNNCCL
jgi:hypothetical protein